MQASAPLQFTLLPPCPSSPARCLFLLGFPSGTGCEHFSGEGCPGGSEGSGRRVARQPRGCCNLCEGHAGPSARAPQSPGSLGRRRQQSQSQTVHLDSFKAGPSRLYLGFLIYLTQISPCTGLGERRKKAMSSAQSLSG